MDGSRRARKSSDPKRAVTESENQGQADASGGSGQGQNQPGTLAIIVSHLRAPFFLLSRWTRTTPPPPPAVVPIAPASEDPVSLPVTQPDVAPAVETAALADHDYSTEPQNVSQPVEPTATEATAAAVVPLDSGNAYENESEIASQLSVEIGAAAAVAAASAIPESINFIAKVNAPAERPKAKPPLTRGQKRKAQLDHTAGWKVRVFQLSLTVLRQVGTGTGTGATNAAGPDTSQAPVQGSTGGTAATRTSLAPAPQQGSTAGQAAAEPKTKPKPAQDHKRM